MPTPIFNGFDNSGNMDVNTKVDLLINKFNSLVIELNVILVQLDAVNVKSLNTKANQSAISDTVYVAATSGGAVTKAITFVNGVRTV